MAHEVRARLTAQFSSEGHALLAYCCRRLNPGPNGESHIAVIVETRDAGRTWSAVSWTRRWLDLLRLGFPVWPPEAVSEIASSDAGVEIVFRDEWVPYEPGGESLWRGRRASSGSWQTKRVRAMRYEKDDSARDVPAVALDLGPHVRPPDEETLRRTFHEVSLAAGAL